MAAFDGDSFYDYVWNTLYYAFGRGNQQPTLRSDCLHSPSTGNKLKPNKVN
jgi:hypothetical protein